MSRPPVEDCIHCAREGHGTYHWMHDPERYPRRPIYDMRQEDGTRTQVWIEDDSYRSNGSLVGTLERRNADHTAISVEVLHPDVVRAFRHMVETRHALEVRFARSRGVPGD